MANAWDIVTAIGAAGSAGILFLLVLRVWSGSPALLAQWIAYRRAKAEERAADWQRLRDENKRMDARCIRLEKSEERCRAELADVKERLATLEGYQIGRAQLRQEMTIIDATERFENPEEKE